MATPKLQWISELAGLVNHATDGDVIGGVIEETIDPLLKKVAFKLGQDWSGKNFFPFQVLAHGFARANNCRVQKISKQGNSIVLEISIKHRLAKASKVNPFR